MEVSEVAGCGTSPAQAITYHVSSGWYGCAYQERGLVFQGEKQHINAFNNFSQHSLDV